MNVFLESASSVAVLLLIGVVGYLMGLKGWMHGTHKQFLNKLLTMFLVPCMCLYGELTNLKREFVFSMGKYLLAVFIAVMVVLVASYGVGKIMRLPRKSWTVFAMVSSISNAMFLGYPICMELFDKACIPYVMVYYMVNTVFTNVVCTGLLQWGGSKNVSGCELMISFAKTPAIWATLVGLVMVVCGINLPGPLLSFTKYMNQALTPLAMLLIGYTVYEIGLRNIRINLRILLSIIFRFLVAPAAMLMACALLGITGIAVKVLVVLSAMPAAALSMVLSSEYGADETMATHAVATTTIGCLLEIPIIMILL